MIVCSRCRNRNLDTAKNCRFCGFPLTLPVTTDTRSSGIAEPISEPLVPEFRDAEPTPRPTPLEPLPPEPIRIIPAEPPVHSTVRTPETPRLPHDADPSDPSQLSNAGTPGASGPIVTPTVVTPPVVTQPIAPRPVVPTPAPASPLAWIIAAVLGLGGSAGGYLVGAHNASVAGNGQTNTQTTEELTRDQAQIKTDTQTVAARDAQIRDLQQQLAQAKALTDQSSQADADRAKDAAAKDAKLRALQHQLTVEQAQSANSAKEHQAALEQMQNASNTAAERAREAEAKSAAAAAEIATLRSRTASTTARATAPKSGQITWTGNVDGKKTIEIRDGEPKTDGTFSGALPGIPVQVRPVDPNIVTIKTAPGSGRGNSWNHLKFEVKGHGMVNATIIWTAEASGG